MWLLKATPISFSGLGQSFFMKLTVFVHRTQTLNNMSSSKEISSIVPVFNGQDFRSWQQKMRDYLGS